MMRDNGQGQERRGCKCSPSAIMPYREGERRITEQHPQNDGCHHEIRGPDHATRHFEGPHAKIVHAGNACADDPAANRGAPPAGIAGGKAKTDGSHHHRHSERQRGQNDAVSG